MKRILLIGLVALIALPAFADLKGDMRRFYGLVQVPGDTPSSNFTNPVAIGGVTLTTTGLDATTTGITAHAGGGQGSAVALTTVFNNVTTCTTAADSVKLLTAVAGTRQVVKNSGAAALAVFPNTSDSINSGSANASVTLQPGEEIEFRAISAVVWTTIETIPRSKLQEEVLQVYPLIFTQWVDGGSVIPLTTPATGTFGIAAVGTGVVGIASAEADNASETGLMVTTFVLPPEYVAAGDVRVIITAKVTAGPASDKTIDVTANEVNVSAGTVGADICATAIQNLTTSFAEYSFTITAAGLVAGDSVQIWVSGAITDSAGGATTTIQIAGVKVVCDIKG